MTERTKLQDAIDEAILDHGWTMARWDEAFRHDVQALTDRIIRAVRADMENETKAKTEDEPRFYDNM